MPVLILWFASLLTYWPLEEPSGLKVGERAPDFTAIDQNGKEIRMSDHLNEGKVVVTFYRGAWCRWCIKQMKELQDSLSFFNEKKATIIAVSPEHEEGIQKTVEKADVTFPLVHDEKLGIMLDYKVISQHKFDEYVAGVKSTGIDNQEKFLPVPTTYVIGQDGKVEFVFFEPNYRERVPIRVLLEYL